MGTEEATDSAQRLAELIDADRERILGEYLAGLEALDNALVRDETALAQAMANGDQILADVIASLQAGQVLVNEGYRFIAWDIGATRAATGAHPSESLQAASVFFRVVLSRVCARLEQHCDAFSLLTRTAIALERSITVRVQASTTGYTSFLLNQVHDAQVNERRRIARDLHDRIGHGISVTHQQLELFSRYQDSDLIKAIEKVEAARRAVRESMQNLRAVTSELHAHEPMKSLDVALMNYLNGSADEAVQTRVRVNGDEAWAGPRVLDEAFLVLREAAHNALRHAAPATLVINVDITPQEIRAFVEDDGCGFDPARPSPQGVGISSMRERTRLLGGILSIRSHVGQGTHVDFSVPLEGWTDGYTD